MAPVTVSFNSALSTGTATWRWDYGDGAISSTAGDTTHAYQYPGSYHVVLTLYNAGGTSYDEETITVLLNRNPTPTPGPGAPTPWSPTATPGPGYHRQSPLANATLSPVDMSLYNKTRYDLTGGGDYQRSSIDSFVNDTVIPFVQTYGPLFWGLLFGGIALAYFIRHESAVIPILLTFTGGLPIIIWTLPYDWIRAIGVVVILVIAALLYALRKKRY
jgi:hypothetical protein